MIVEEVFGFDGWDVADLGVQAQVVGPVDYLTELRDRRAVNQREDVDRYVQPAYETAELVYRDSLSATLQSRRAEVDG